MFCLHQTLGLIPHSQRGLEREREREGDLPQQGGRGNAGMSGWMEQRMGHVTPTLDDHVGVNVITVIITAYMMKWRKSADAECSHPRCGYRYCEA